MRPALVPVLCAVVLCAGALTGCVSATGSDDPAGVVARVDLPSRYTRVDGETGCIDAEACWRVDALPGEVEDELVAVLEEAGAADVAFTCLPDRTSDGEPVACIAEGTAGSGTVSIAVARDFDYSADVAPDATETGDLPVEAFVGSSTVVVGEDIDL